MTGNVQLFFVVSLITILLTNYVSAMAYDLNKLSGPETTRRCERNPEVETNCQKCAKITKSSIVYPMCCTDKDEAYRWCYNYVNFGLHKRIVNSPLAKMFDPLFQDKSDFISNNML